MKFSYPYWLLGGLAALALLLVLYWRQDLRQRALLADFASSHLLAQLTASFSPARRWVKRGLFCGAIAFFFIALARPQWGYHWEEQKQQGIDILFAIDTSKSMLTQDVTPDRLTRAKLATTDFVRKLDGDRVGLIAFAGEAFLQAPLTLDYDAFGEALDSIDTATIPRGGTDIASALQEAQLAFGPGNNKKILVLITDGEDLEGRGIEEAKAAAKDGLTIYTVGVGSPAGGLIPVPSGGGTEFLKNEAGEYVKSHLDDTTLRAIASATGGIYQPLGQQGEGLQSIYNQALASMPKHELASKREKVFEERFEWPLAAGLVLLLASLLVGTRRRARMVKVRTEARQAVLRTALVALMVAPVAAHASISGAHDAYLKGDYSQAQKQYEGAAQQDPKMAALQFNVGASAYKNGDFETAFPAFQKALSTSDLTVQQQAYYNLGNTQFRRGEKTLAKSPQDTIKTWHDSLDDFDAALKLKATDADAMFNRDLVAKKLKELEKANPPKQKPDKNQQNDKQDQDQKQQQQQNQDQKDQSNNNQKDQQKQDQPNSGSQPQQDQKPEDNQDQQKQDQQAKNQQDQRQQQQQTKGGQADSKNDPSSQQQKTANGQDQNHPADQKGDPQQKPGDQPQTAQNGEQAAGNRGATIPSADQKGNQKAEDAEPVKPGEMSREEARQLLESLKDGEHVLPVTVDARNDKRQDQTVLKDW